MKIETESESCNWDVQEKVGDEWISVYSSPFDNWYDAKEVFDDCLLADRELRLIRC